MNGGQSVNKQRFTYVFGTLFILTIAFAGSASASGLEVECWISPDMIMLNSNTPSISLEINNSSASYPGYNIKEINASSVELWIDVKDKDNNIVPVRLGSYTPIKDPEINAEYDKLVLMYDRSQIFRTPVNTTVYSGDVEGYLRNVSASGTGHVNFKITGSFNNGNAFYGNDIVDVMINKQGGIKGGGKNK